MMAIPRVRTTLASVHKIREFDLEKVHISDEFDILQIVGEGWFGKILLVEHRSSDKEMVLKALPKAYIPIDDFYREFHYGLHLAAHKNINTTFDIAFETPGFYVFAQEYAPLGDLTSNVYEDGIGELHSKRVGKQLGAALTHLHAKELVHRDIKLDNILVFKSDFSRIKLCDFGETRRAGTVCRRRNEWLPYAPPEVLQVDTDNSYKAMINHDVWQFGIVLFVCLTGCLPWQKATHDDPRYSRYLTWHQSALTPIRRQPKLFKLVSSRGQKLFRKFLEPKPEKRPTNLTELQRFMDDRWLAKFNEKTNEYESRTEDDGLCPSMYSFHSSPEEKNKLLSSLTAYGLEATVDRAAKKDRIRAWIQSSIITEDDEDGGSNEGDKTESSSQKENTVNEPYESNPSAPPRRLKKRDDEPYTTPIDPTIPLEKQKAEALKLISIRNPNAFLNENNNVISNVQEEVLQVMVKNGDDESTRRNDKNESPSSSSGASTPQNKPGVILPVNVRDPEQFIEENYKRFGRTKGGLRNRFSIKTVHVNGK